jgi:phosphocarrier protein HPr
MVASQEVEVVNKLGIHARAAAKFVKLAANFNSEIEIERKKQRVNGKSIMGVMMLAASRGTLITIHAEGEDAEEGVEKLVTLIKNRFGEDE